MAKKRAAISDYVVSGDGRFVDISTADVAHIAIWSPKADSLLLCTRSGMMHLIAADGTERWQVLAHSKTILKASWNYDGTLISTSGVDGAGKIWRALDGRLLVETASEFGWIEHLSWSPLLPLLLTASNNKLRLLTEKANIVDELHSHRWPVTDIAWHPTVRDTFASCAADGIRIWKLGLRQPIRSLSGSEYPEHLAFNRNGTVLSYGTSDGSIQIWTTGSDIVLKAKTGVRGLSCIDWSWGGQWLSFCGEHEAFLWALNERAPRAAKPQKLHGCFGHLKHLQFHTYEHLLAAADDEGSIHIWRTDREERLMPVSMCHYDFSVVAMNWNPLCRQLAIAYANGLTRIWSNNFD